MLVLTQDAALSPLELAALFGISTDNETAARRYVLERLVVRPGFPSPCTPPGMRKAWKYSEVMAWRELTRVSPPVRRRSRCSTATAISGRGGQ